MNEVRTTLRDDLIAAKALIDTPEKWGKGAYIPREGCYCALGAVAKVADHDPEAAWSDDRVKGLWDALAAALPGSRDVPTFNDRPTTTHADIMALFDRAIASAESSS